MQRRSVAPWAAFALLFGVSPLATATEPPPAQDLDARETVVGEKLAILRDGEHVEVRQGEWLLLRYRYGGSLHKPYVASLLSPAGTQVLRDSPFDHLHHHALMLAWSVDGTNFWEEVEGCGRQRHVGWSEVRIATVRDRDDPWALPVEQAILREEISWEGPGGAILLEETRLLIIRELGQDGPTLLTWQSTFTAPRDGEGATLTGASYNGLGARFPAAMDTSGRFLNSGGARGVTNTNEARSTWCAYSADIDPDQGTDGAVTVVMFDAPSNPRRPSDWFTMDAPFAYLAATLSLDEQPLELEPGQTFTLRYGVAVFDGVADGPEIDAVYARWQAHAIEIDSASAPGLIGRYYVGTPEGEPVAARIDAAVAFDWSDGAPDERLPRGPLAATWEGEFFVQVDGSYRFSGSAEGELDIWVDGAAAGDAALPLERGFHALRAVYTSTGERAAVKLLWESEVFPLEVLGARYLTHRIADEENIRNELAYEQGRSEVERRGCIRCHEIPGLADAAKPGPPLERGAGMSAEYLARWLRAPHAVRPGTRMPSFERLRTSAGDTDAVVAFLRSREPSSETSQRLASKGNRYRQRAATSFTSGSRNGGRELFHRLGCIACHAPETPIEGNPTSAPTLADVGAKWSRTSILLYLETPLDWHPTGRMPDFRLTEMEAADLAAYLSTFRTLGDGVELEEPTSRERGTEGEQDTALVRRGLEIVDELRCAACHDIPGVADPVRDAPAQDGLLGNWIDRGCLAETPTERAGTPRFALGLRDRTALAEYLERRPLEPREVASTERALRTVRERFGCLECHTRDGAGAATFSRGLVRYLGEHGAGGVEASALVAPDLSGVGAKLRTEWIHETLAGNAASPRPWLSVRMPHFAMSDTEREGIVRWLVAADGIPGFEARTIPAALPEHLETAAVELLGQNGFSCATCHFLGRHEPPNDTLGPDLAMVGQRIDRAWFLRWLDDPARVRPGTPMPAFTSPAAEIAGEDLALQKEILWKYLTTTPPDQMELSPVPAREVRVTGDRARAVLGRVQGAPPLRAARAVAIGFPGGRSVLFDGDRLAWLGLWEGGFLREVGGHGARHHWVPDGAPRWTNPDLSPPILFRETGSGSWHAPASWRERHGWLDEVSFEGGGVRLEYRLRAPGADDLDPEAGPWVHIRELVESSPVEQGGVGFTRSIEIAGVPLGYEAVVQVPFPRQFVEQQGHTRPGVIGATLAERPAAIALAEDGALAVRAASASAARWITPPAEISYGILEPLDDEPRDPGRRVESVSRPGAGRLAILCPTPTDGSEIALVVQTTGYAAGAEIATGPPSPPSPDGLSEAPEPALYVTQPTQRESLQDTSSVTLPAGFQVRRLPLPEDFLVCALTFWRGKLVVGGYDGEIRLAEDTDGDGLPDAYRALAGTFDQVNDLRVVDGDLYATTPGAVFRVRDRDGDWRSEAFEVVSSAWDWAGHPFDWTFGLVADESGNLYVGTSTPYERGAGVVGEHFRGGVLRIAPDGRTTAVGRGMRYNFGFASNQAGRIYFTGNQGQWYLTCTIHQHQDGSHYGYGEPDASRVTPPVLQVPYPWCRSLTGLAFAESEVPFGPFQGQGFAADYNTQRIIRWTDEPVGERRQGACYPFLDGLDAGPTQMTFGPDGALYVGFMSDGSWYPERARGGVYVITASADESEQAFAVRRASATRDGFAIELTAPADPASVGPQTCERVHRYFHEYRGSYHSDEIAHEDVPVTRIELSADGRTLLLKCGPHVTPRIYSIQLRGLRSVSGKGLESGEMYLTVHTMP